MENTSRLHLEFQVRFLFLIAFWDDISFKRSILKVFPNNTFQCRQSLCCVNLLMEARRSDRAKGNICRTAGPGREMGTRWVNDHFLSPVASSLLNLWYSTLIFLTMTQPPVFVSPGRNDADLWPHHSLTERVSTAALTNALYAQREWDHVFVVANFFINFSFASGL